MHSLVSDEELSISFPNVFYFKRIDCMSLGSLPSDFRITLLLLRVFEKKVLKRKFGPMKEEVTGGGRRFHDEKSHRTYLHFVTRGNKIG